MPATASQTKNKSPLKVAQDPHTPSETLITLFENADAHSTRTRNYKKNDAVLAALTQNPNIPPDYLAVLLDEYPQAFCLNPVAPLLLLENPAFFADISSNSKFGLLKCADLPEALAHALTRDADTLVASEARYHIALAPPDWNAADAAQTAWPNALSEACRDYCQYAPSQDEQQFVADYRDAGLLPAWKEAEYPLPDLQNNQLSVPPVRPRQKTRRAPHRPPTQKRAGKFRRRVPASGPQVPRRHAALVYHQRNL